MTKQTQTTREDRLAEALRANLRRRKDQARARKNGENPEPGMDTAIQTNPISPQDPSS